MNKEIRAEEELIEQPELSKGNEVNKFDQSDTEEIGKELADEKLDVTEINSDIKDEAPEEEEPVEGYPDSGENDYSAEDYSESNVESVDETKPWGDYPDCEEDENLSVEDTSSFNIETQSDSLANEIHTDFNGESAENNDKNLSPAENNAPLEQYASNESIKEISSNVDESHDITSDGFKITSEINDALTTEKDTAYFWSGLGPQGHEIAKERAVNAGGTTLENQLEINNIEMPEWSIFDQDAQAAWKDVSSCYAENCSGNVTVLSGKIREGSVFDSIEYDKLKDNPNVSSITLVDNNTGDKQVVFDREHPENNAVKTYYNEGNERFVKFERSNLNNETNRY